LAENSEQELVPTKKSSSRGMTNTLIKKDLRAILGKKVTHYEASL